MLCIVNGLSSRRDTFHRVLAEPFSISPNKKKIATSLIQMRLGLGDIIFHLSHLIPMEPLSNWNENLSPR